MLDQLPAQSPDALLALIKMYAADPRSDKIDLGVGVYRTDDGATPVFAAIKAAEANLLETQDSKSYLGPEGDVAFVRALVPYVFGADAAYLDRVEGMQTPGGTGAVRLALAVAQKAGVTKVHMGVPSWPNHAQILADVGLETVTFGHADSDGRVDVEAVLAIIDAAAAGEAVLLHGCCHNPTGIDYSPAQWDRIAAAFADSPAIPILDLAYQGLGAGMDDDAYGVRAVVSVVPEALVAYSCDKNFGMYRDRVGALYVLADQAGQLDAIMSNLNALARASWSMPPDHGAAAVRVILSDSAMTKLWLDELTAMRARIASVRAQMAEAGQIGPLDLTALSRENGLFSMLALTKDQIASLREDHAVYMAGSGRINVAGLHSGNIANFIAALKNVAG
ncbi:amino acid aminotransferase [Allopontixanthobacter sediminis]|uniref:Aminotransferase class I/II-fold pyridoxal phosphate-dependent enzyme n=1 Tax=Allopontixanthobacter sediminis TaxID=1689985 RepID=A0A845B680_9SPHN|nr:aromatic amino acid transaminase [Allopontixanthobacter sediminis]MXP44992.1 aminotransferase class I/II-fold pyridoxal phosphate-dependent enzyme [Allopontixanthobacter sediminis]